MWLRARPLMVSAGATIYKADLLNACNMDNGFCSDNFPKALARNALLFEERDLLRSSLKQQEN